MKYFLLKILILFTLFSPVYNFAQFELKDSVLIQLGNISQLSVGNLGQIQLINNESELIRISKSKEIFRKPLKKIVSQMDLNLGLRTGVVYNHQELELLDDKLNPIQDRINLNQHQIFPSKIALISSQWLWYFDPIENRLVQWNYQLKDTMSKSDILFFKDGDTTIEEIYAYKNRIFLKSQHSIYELDIFGNFKADFQLKPHIKHSFSNDYLFLYNENSIERINLINRDISSFDNFFNGKDFIMSDDQLFVIKNKGLYIYTRIKK